MRSVGIVGAGIAGLSATYLVQKRGIDVHVFEATDRAGGTIQSTSADGYLFEHGPNLLRPHPPVLNTLIRDLGLSDEVVPVDPSTSTRYIVRNGTLVPVPTSLWALVTTNLFSTRAKLRLLAEPFIGVSSSQEESVASFARRRLGPESLDYAVNPVVGGTFAGDPEQLSMRHVFGKFFRRERKYGSLLRGTLHANGKTANGNGTPDSPTKPFSFRGGLGRLPQALAVEIGDRISYEAPVIALSPDESGCEVTVETNSGIRRHRFEAVICTLPLHQFALIDVETSVDCACLDQVPYPPVSVLNLGFRRDEVGHSLSGTGFLVPEAENRFHILGTIFSSSLFPRRAPNDHVLLTTFVGGMRNQDLGACSTSALLPLVTQDLNALLGLHGSPAFVHHTRLPYALPQYTLDHGEVQATLDALESEHPPLFFAGNYRDGISVGAAMASGAEAARRVAEA